jgi:hypothetical protein
MNGKNLLLTQLTILGLLAAGCSSPPPAQAPLPPVTAPIPAPASAPTPEQMAALCQQSPETCHRLENGQPLILDDIKVMAKLGFKDDAIIAEVRNSRTVFHLTASSIIDLKNAGVSDAVIDFMISTPNSVAGWTPMPEPEPTTNYSAAQTPPPQPPDEVQPPTPGPDYIWVGGDWVWNNGWVWVGGRWVYPPWPGAVWINGRWGHRYWGGYRHWRGHWH